MGFMILDRLAKDWRCRFSRMEGTYQAAGHELSGQPVLLIKPMTFMNRSGSAVEKLAGRFPVDRSRLLIICDDLNLTLGRMRLREKGSDGGHNGLASIAEALNTTDFPRLRLGIGPPEKDDTARWVLSPFYRKEWKQVRGMIDRAVCLIEDVVLDGFERAMNRYNRNV